MDETKEKLNWQRLLITTGIVLVTAAAVGGTVWYLMDQNAKSIANSNAKSIASLEKQVNELKGLSSVKTTTTKTPTNTDTSVSQTTTKTVDNYTLLKDYCVANNPDMTVAGVKVFQNADGVWGGCGVGNPGGGGAIAFYKKANDSWTKMYVGNGMAERTVCDMYQVPREMWFCQQ